MVVTVGSSDVDSPAPESLADLRRFVLDYIQGLNDPELLDVARRELNRAIDRCNTRNWNRLVSYQQITFVAGTEAYEFSADARAPRALWLEDSSGNRIRRLEFLNQKTFAEDARENNANGDPFVYTIRYDTRRLELDVPPSTSFVLRHPTATYLYYRRLAYLVQASDQHNGPPEFNSFIGWQARWGIAAIRGEMNLAQIAKVEAKDCWQLMIRDDNETYTDWMV